jgi:hypothetical protein
MVYCMTETNLWPSRPESEECPTNKGSAAVLPRGGTSHLRRTYEVLAFMTGMEIGMSGSGTPVRLPGPYSSVKSLQ